MKAITAVCQTGSAATVTQINNTGRISRHRDGENAEIQMYLSKLKDLVPYMPKNKKLSKLEVIQNVIDYICDLQTALETTSGAGSTAAALATFDPAAVLNGGTIINSSNHQQNNNININYNNSHDSNNSNNNNNTNYSINNHHQHRQPLGVRSSPNTTIQQRRVSINNNNNNNNTSLNSHHHQQQQHQQQHSPANCDLTHSTSDKHGGHWSS